MLTYKTEKNLSIYISYILLGAGGLLIDRVVKLWASEKLKRMASMPIIRGIIEFNYAENRGAAFSMLEGQFTLFYIITAVIFIGIIWLIASGRIRSSLAEYSLVMILTGGIGNFVDRFTDGYVIDMFNFQFIDFAVFNVADIYITCGSVLFLLIFLVSKGDIVKW